MPRKRLALRLLLTAFLGLVPGRGDTANAAEMDKAVRIGSLGDQSSIVADVSGIGSVIAAKMAIEDSGLLSEGWTIDVIAADHMSGRCSSLICAPMSVPVGLR